MSGDDALRLRTATLDDVPALARLIERSVRGLAPGFYAASEIDQGLAHVFGVDTQIIGDGTYFILETADGAIAGAGGWSRRGTLYGGDGHRDHAHAIVGDDAPADALLRPGIDAARIRAMFVDPDWARRGLGRRLFEASRQAAAAEGFTTLELVATLPGVPLYVALGFEAFAPIEVPLPDGGVLRGQRMRRPV